MTYLVVGTPMYGGQACMGFTESVSRLRNVAHIKGVRCSTIFMANESLIQRARNTIVWHFLNDPSATHLLFCDADQSFDPIDALKMMAANKPIILAPVPMKNYDWKRIADAAKRGVPPDQLKYQGTMFNLEIEIDRAHPPETPVEIKRGGTGFMLIQRGVFETLKGLKECNKYHDDIGQIARDEWVYEFFKAEIEGDRHHSEDYGFCNMAARAGFKIWLAPWVKVSHFGTHEFMGDFVETYQRKKLE